MPKTFCFINEKGGVGKTSTCFHLAGGFAGNGLRTLLIDMDPQASLSRGILGPNETDELAAESNVAAIFDESLDFFDWSTVIQETSFDDIDLCPTNRTLGEYNRRSPEGLGMTQFALRDFIEEQTAYDLVLIDCPPNLYSCTWTTLIAADWVVIPVTPEDFGSQGLRAVHQAIVNARQLNPGLRRLGHLLTRCDSRLLVHDHYEQLLRKRYGNLILEGKFPELSAFKVAVAARKPVEFSEPRSRAAKLTRALCREILDRTDAGIDNQRVA